MPKEPDLTGAEVVNICSDYMNETDLLLVEKAQASAFSTSKRSVLTT